MQTVLILAGIILLGSALYLWLGWKKFLNAFQIELEPNQNLPELHNVPYETLYYPTANQKILKTWLLKQPDRPDNNAIAIVAHGWTRNSSFLWPISYHLWKAGFTVVALNARNHGESDVDPPMSVYKYVEDLQATMTVIRSLYPKASVLVAGHSLGGAASIIFSGLTPEIKGVAALCPFSSSREIFLMDIRQAKVPLFPFGLLLLKFAEVHIGHSFRDLAPVNFIGRIQAKMLLIASEKDQRIPSYMQRELSDAAPDGNKPQTLIISGATHTSLLTEPETQNAILDFFLSLDGIRENLNQDRSNQRSLNQGELSQ
ncbi:MAG: alpha/beta hydrolase [Bacteroidetes bacterium]|nr:alpha/beta hydrolase [Bacteroidota bacterium]